MTLIKEAAIDEIKKMPDSQVIYVINIIRGINGLSGENRKSKMESFRQLDSLVGTGTGTVTDYDSELASYREKKYGV